MGELFCGKRNGIGVYYNMNGDVSVGKWANGNMQGESIYFYTDGSVYVGSIRENRKEGFGRFLYPNGDVYEGDWLRNKKNGQGIYFYYASESIYEGNWVLNYKEGWGTFYSRGGEWTEGEWRTNKIIVKSSSGIDENLPRAKNIVDFFTNRRDWEDIISRLQEILNKRVDENYNYVDAKDYEFLESEGGIREQREEVRIERSQADRREVSERIYGVEGSKRENSGGEERPRGSLRPLIQLDGEKRSEVGSAMSKESFEIVNRAGGTGRFSLAK